MFVVSPHILDVIMTIPLTCSLRRGDSKSESAPIIGRMGTITKVLFEKVELTVT